MKKKKTMRSWFDEFLETELWSSTHTKFPYADDDVGRLQKEAITNALIVLKFLRKQFNNNRADVWATKRKFIAELLLDHPLAQGFKLVRTVAMIEALPTTVWRKLLWRENIDNPDYETCLRRLSDEQQQAIEDNYADLFLREKPVIPRVLKKSLRDRVKTFLRIYSPEKLLKEDYQDFRRHQSKRAYAFSLLGLDFGFSLYPFGINDDRKITNQKYTRFLSIKAHINDFSINTEDGKYWWLYKTARSNWAFYPNKIVELGDRVCPGFWLTFIIHTLFWIVSPIALAITGTVIARNGLSLPALIPAAFALPMIIWSIVLILRMIFTTIFRIIKKNKVIRAIGVTIGIIIIIAIILVVAASLITIIGLIIGALSPVAGPLLSAAFVISAAFYVYFLIFVLGKDYPPYKYKDIPAFIRFLLHLSVGAFAIVMFDKFAAEHVISFIVWFAAGTWEWYTSNLLLSNWLIGSIAFTLLFFYFFNLFMRDEKKFIAFEKTFSWLTKGFLVISIILFAILVLKNGAFQIYEIGLAPISALSFVFLAGGYSIMMLKQVNHENIDERQQYEKAMIKMDINLSGISRKTLLLKLEKSPWLCGLDAGKRTRAIVDIQILTNYLFDRVSDRVYFLELIAAKGSFEKIGYLSRLRVEFATHHSYSETREIVELIINGNSFEEAKSIYNRKHETRMKFQKRASKIGTIIAYPFVMAITGIVLAVRAIAWVFIAIGRFFGTLKDLWDLFNKMCPYVTKSQYLE